MIPVLHGNAPLLIPSHRALAHCLDDWTASTFHFAALFTSPKPMEKNTSLLFEHNSTLGSGNITDAPDRAPPTSEIVPILMVLAVAIFLAVFGNGFTIYAFLRFPELRTPFNSFIFNLAVADLVVGLIVMPSFAVYNYHGYWPWGEPLCSVWIWTDWFMTFESVVTLAVISVERLWSLRWPIHYQQSNSPKKILRIILLTWSFVVCLWLPGYVVDRMRDGNVVEDCAWDPSKNYAAGVAVGLLGYLIPYLLMMVCYVYVGLKMRKRLKNVLPKVLGGRGQPSGFTHFDPTMSRDAKSIVTTQQEEQHSSQRQTNGQKLKTMKASVSRDKSVLLTLGAIVAAFSVCWIPFYVYFFVTLFEWTTLPAWFGTLTYWTAYLNSALNPVLYTALHRDFRQKFLDLVKTIFRPLNQ
ncbi:putative 5-hydroxytryptamine receptor 1 [Hypsibius exemplaris]|uniref:5-hydroxytryptamine receptor 1 n=1 Tax=Hypsibius exemplaris TaxID=2072580 RepID=A0A1W0WKF1_HYPEX|nr:putative 5-hydroxytryptamine receptor 1 [Hypsibius exemplaris]